MAKSGILLLSFGLFLGSFLSLISLGKGDFLPSPKDIYFELQFYSHILHWSPGEPKEEGVVYEVKFQGYGTELSETAPNCSQTHLLSCDLTMETLPLSKGYFGMVRSRLGNKASNWVRTVRYTNKEVILPAPTFSIHVQQNSLFVDVVLPQIQTGDFSLHYFDVFSHDVKYIAHLRRTTDNFTVVVDKNETRFYIDNLIKGREYCVSMEFSITARDNRCLLSPESCVYLPVEELNDSALQAVASSVLVFLLFLILINLIICCYVRKGMKTPKTLKSLIQRSWSWMEKAEMQVPESTDSLRWVGEVTDHFKVEPSDSPSCSSNDSGFGSTIFQENRLHLQSTSALSCGKNKDIAIPTADIDCKVTFPAESFCNTRQDPEIQSEDSGISLSTGSLCLKRNCGILEITYGENEHGRPEDTCCDVGNNLRLDYLRQSEPQNDQQSSNSVHQEITQTKDYFTQSKHELQIDNIIDNSQSENESFQGTWTHITEGFHCSIPFTTAFSPFSRVLCDFGLSAPTLGDVQILDVGS